MRAKTNAFITMPHTAEEPERRTAPETAAPSLAVAVPATNAPAVSPEPVTRQIAFTFTGSPGEYFRIWIINNCMNILTLGVFSAWAKVRKKQYLYSHTLLDGTPFEYLGRPVPILKGRVIAAVLFAIWYVATHFVTALLPLAALGAVVLAPWVMVQSLAFNARYSAFRNMTFQFNGTYWGAARVICAGLLLVPLTLGFYFPVWKQRLQRFAAQHTAYGGVNAGFGAKGSEFFAVHFLAGLVAFIPFSLVVGVLTVGHFVNGQALVRYVAVGFWVVYLIVSAHIRANLDSLVWRGMSLGPFSFRYELSGWGLLWLYASNLVAIALSLGLLIPWATIRTVRYRAARFQVFLTGDLRAFRQTASPPVRAAGAELGDFFDLDFSL